MTGRSRTSAGLLMFRRKEGEVEVLLVHPGGPYFQNKDDGVWTIPKGEAAEGEDLLARAKIEFEEELGISPSGDWIELGSIKQKGGKTVYAWAFRGDLKDDFKVLSNRFEMEWPPRSGQMKSFPEVDQATFFPLEAAKQKINRAQVAFLDRLVEILDSREAGGAWVRPLFLFAPGAGAPSSHPWMRHWEELLSTIGEVHPFDYPYMQQGRRRPDPRPQLIAAHRQALAEIRRDIPTFLIGKSMGGRMGCHVALEEKVEGVICLGYPLCGGGDPAKLRDEVLRALRTPVLFVQGTRDSLCPLDLLDRVRGEMTTRNSLHVAEGGDHSLVVSKRQLAAIGESQADVDRRILEAIAKFVAEESNQPLS